MKIHVLEQEQHLPISLPQAWEFFATPKNLNQITPSDLEFAMTYCAGDSMYEGQIITYRIAIAPLIKVNWVTEIRSVHYQKSFIDVQIHGPYALWHHLHRFEETASGVRMLDRVHYAMPFGPLGTIAHHLFVRKKLHHIFQYRRSILDQLFTKTTAPS